MRARTAMLPGAVHLARLPAEPSTEAKRRMNVVKWYLEHDRRLRLTARHFGFSPDTVRRWASGYERSGVNGLENGSRRPRNVRQPLTPPDVLKRILELREENPAWGRRSSAGCSLTRGLPSLRRASTARSHASKPAASFANRSASGSSPGRACTGPDAPETWSQALPEPSSRWTASMSSYLTARPSSSSARLTASPASASSAWRRD